MSFLPLLAFQTLLARCHIFPWDRCYFYRFILQCLSLFWHGMVYHFTLDLLAFSWCCALCFEHMLCGSCARGMCHFSSGIHAVCCDCYNFLLKHGLWLDGKWFCLFDIRFVDDSWYSLTYIVVSCITQSINLIQSYCSAAHVLTTYLCVHSVHLNV